MQFLSIPLLLIILLIKKVEKHAFLPSLQVTKLKVGKALNMYNSKRPVGTKDSQGRRAKLNRYTH